MLHKVNTFENFINYCENSDYIWAHTTIDCLPNLIFSKFLYHQQPYFNIINTTTAKSYSSPTIIDDLVANATTDFQDWAHIIGANNGSLYVAYPYGLLENVRNDAALSEIYESMDSESNDLIIVFKEKE